MFKFKKKGSAPENAQAQDATQNGVSTAVADAPQQPVRNKYADKMNKTQKKVSKKVKRIIGVVVLVAVVVGAVMLVKNVLAGQKQVAEGGGTSVSMRGRLETFVSGYGSVVPKDKSELGKNTKGKVTEVSVKTGDIVKPGQVIFKVDPSDAQKDLDAAMSELDAAVASVSDAQKSIENLNIRAPFDGKIVKLEKLKAGQQLSNGSAFATIVDDKLMKLPLYFSYTYIDKMKVGMGASVSIPSSMSSVQGSVSAIERVKKISDDGTVLFKVVIEMKNPGTLKKDMTATAVVGTMVPSEAGKLEYSREEDIVAKTNGEIKKISALEYYEYKSGGVLCNLENDTLSTTLKGAERTRISAQKKVEDLQKAVNESTVTSPIEGVVTALMVNVGDDLTGTGTAVATVANLNTMMVDIEVDEMDIGKVTVGLPVTISVDQSDGTTDIQGNVVDVTFQAKSNGSGGGGGGGASASYFPAKIQIENQNHLLMPGMGVNYKISANVREDCIMVPSSAIVYAGDGTAAVYAKPLEGQPFEKTLPTPENANIPKEYVLVPVTAGITDGKNTEIVSGLNEGIEVYLATPSENDDGMGGGNVMVG